jgi:hypothetical protein
MVQIRKFYHRGDFRIGIYFGFENELRQKARSIGTRWSQANKCRYFPRKNPKKCYYSLYLINIHNFFLYESFKNRTQGRSAD